MSNALGFSALHGDPARCGELWLGESLFPCVKDAGHGPADVPLHRNAFGLEWTAVDPLGLGQMVDRAGQVHRHRPGLAGVPTIGQFTQVVAALFGVQPAQLHGWVVLVHNTGHEIGFMTSSHSVEHPGTRAETIEILEAALGQLREDT